MSEQEKELLFPGHSACAGCGAMILARHVLRILGENTIVVLPASCFTLLAGLHPFTAIGVPLLHCAFATGAATASGVRAELDLAGDEETTVLVWAGDGGTFDIGIQALSGAAERNENILYACYDNEAYMNTGIQRSSATPFGAWTTTTPKGMTKKEPKKHIVEIMAAHRIPYAATATMAFPEDFEKKVKTAKEIKGTRFLHLLSPCVAGWKIESHRTIEFSRLAVETNIFPLYEVRGGEKWIINYRPKQVRPAKDYLKPQGRFSHLTEKEIQVIQKKVDEEWQRLLKKEQGN